MSDCESSSSISDVESSDYEIEVEDFIVKENSAIENIATGPEANSTSAPLYAYNEEPIASEQWVSNYLKTKEEQSQLEEELEKRLSGETPNSQWCKCQHCEIKELANISECYCCSELDGCVESLNSELVLQDTNNTELNCITKHPGFKPVCLEKWSLRLAADKYKKRNNEKYKQTGSEERFLRSVAYREFTRMVYGFLGTKKRYPLPSCAYNAIRKTFASKDEQQHRGFEMEDA